MSYLKTYLMPPPTQNTLRAFVMVLLEISFISYIFLKPWHAFAKNTPNINPTVEQIKEIIQNEKSDKYFNPSGYLALADEYFSGNMLVAFILTSKALGSPPSIALTWGSQYPGTTENYLNDKKNLLTLDQVNRTFFEPNGYILYADMFNSGNMTLTYNRVSAVLGQTRMKKLRWGTKYQGTTSKYTSEQKQFMKYDHSPESNPYFGRLGYIKYAQEFYQGNMLKAYSNVSSVLGSRFSNINWGSAYSGHVNEYSAEYERIFLESKINNEFVGRAGYVEYSRRFYNGDMLKAYKNISSITSPDEFAVLDWGTAYRGMVNDYLIERARFYQGDVLFTDRIGVDGYIAYADLYYDGNMQKAYTNALGVLSSSEFLNLDWPRSFNATTNELRNIRNFIFANEHNWLGKYTGLTNAVYTYLTTHLEIENPDDKVYQKYRNLFRSAFNRAEIKSLGWNSVKSKRQNPPRTCQAVFANLDSSI